MSIFMQSVDRPSLYESWTERRFDPLGGLSTGSMLGDLIAPAAMSHLFGSRGFLPGQFFPTQNVYDQIQASRYQQQRMAAVSAGFQADRPEMIAGMRGLAGSLGLDPSPATLNAMAGMVETAAPFLAGFAPQTVDSLFGARGSRGMAADLIFRRGRHDVDPVTGMIGLSTDSAAARTSGLYDELYGAPGGAGLGRMRGMGVGTAAAVATEASRMGLGAASIGAMSAEGRAAALGGADVDPESLRGYDSRKTADKVRELAGAVSAIRDLFGENGRADAPMSTLFKALNDLTQGGFQFGSPQKLEADVRSAQALMRAGGMSLDAYASLTAKAGQAAAASGLDQGFGAGIAQGAAAYGIAYGTTGLGEIRGPGALSREQAVARDVELRASAGASGQAADIAAIIAFQEEIGGLQGRDLELYEAFKTGKTTLADGTSTRLRYGDAAAIIGRAKGGGFAASWVRDRDSNQRYAADNDVAGLARRLQADEATDLAGRAFAAATGLTGEAAAAGARSILDMDATTFADPSRRRDAVAAALEGAGVAAPAARDAAALGLRATESEWKRHMGVASLEAGYQLHNRTTHVERERRSAEAREDAAMQGAFSAMGRQGPLTRLVEVLKGPSEGLVDGIARFMGGIPADEVGRTLGVAAASATAGQRLGVVAGGVNAGLEEFDAVRQAGGEGAAAKAAELTSQVQILVSGDASQAEAVVTEFRKRHNLSDDAMAALERGEAVPGVAPAEARRVRAMIYAAKGTGNVVAAAEAAGVRAPASVSGKELNAAAAGAMNAASALEQGLASASPATRARLGRGGASALAEADRIAGLAIADESGETAAAMGMGRGAGSVEAFRVIREKAAAVRAIADKQGIGVDALLAGEGGPADEARKLSGEAAQAASRLAAGSRGRREDYSGMAADDPRRKKYDAEKAALAALRGDEADPKAAARSQIDAILAQTGTTLGGEEKDALIGKVAGAKDPAAALAGLSRAAEAEKRIRAAEARGDSKALDGLEEAAGPLGDLRRGGVAASPARTGEILAKAVEAQEAKAPKSGGPASGREPIHATFTPGSRVKIEGDELAFSGGLQLEGDMDMTVG